MPPPPATQSSSRGEGGVKLKLCLRRNWCGRKCGTGAYLGSEAENKVLLFHVDKRTYCHFNTILCYLLPRNASVAPLMGTAFVGYSFEFVFEGLGHKFRFILPLTEYPPLYQFRTLTARMCFTQHITAYLFFATTFRLYFVAAN